MKEEGDELLRGWTGLLRFLFLFWSVMDALPDTTSRSPRGCVSGRYRGFGEQYHHRSGVMYVNKARQEGK
jgi:hypothetical protein